MSSSSSASVTARATIRQSTGFRLPHVLRVFLAVDLVLLSFAFLCEIVSRFGLHLGYPYRSPLLSERFPDLVTLRTRFTYLHTLKFFTDTQQPRCMYPAPVIAAYSFFYLFKPYDLVAFLLFAILSFSIAAFFFGRALIRRGLATRSTVLLVSIALLTAYPLWFTCNQANMEICVWVLLSLGVFFFLKGRGYAAGALFGIAGAMKIFPFVYLGLLLARRQYRQVLFAFVAAAAVTLPALWLAYPHLLESWRLTNASVAYYRPLIMLHVFPQTSFDHSLFGLIKICLHPLPPPSVLDPILTACLAACALGGLLLYILRIRHLPIINQVLCLCVASILFPPTSFDYTLMQLYAPWALLAFFAIQPQDDSRSIPGLKAAFICFAILFVPETEFIVRWHTPYSLGGQIKALTLIVLFIIGLRYPFDWRESDRQNVVV